MTQLNNSSACQDLKEIYKVLEPTLPTSFWLTELSSPEIFSQQRYRFGEVISNPRGEKWQAIASVHLPGLFLTPHVEGEGPLVVDVSKDVPYRHIIRE